jgi:hypothetical protein
MKKQTAVEWLYELLRDNHKEVFDGNIWEQAKAMEKEQIVEAFYQCGKDNFEHIKVINRSANDYYNETYKGGEQ